MIFITALVLIFVIDEPQQCDTTRIKWGFTVNESPVSASYIKSIECRLFWYVFIVKYAKMIANLQSSMQICEEKTNVNHSIDNIELYELRKKDSDTMQERLGHNARKTPTQCKKDSDTMQERLRHNARKTPTQ